MELAEYIDGRLSDEDRIGRIEIHLARCAACLEVVSEVRELRAEGDVALVFVPPQVLQAAMKLVPEAIPSQVGEEAGEEEVGGSGAYGGIPLKRYDTSIAPATRTARRRLALWISITQRSAAAAAAVAIGVLGHHVGASLSSPASSGPADSTVAAEMSFGLLEDSGDDAGAAEMLNITMPGSSDSTQEESS